MERSQLRLCIVLVLLLASHVPTWADGEVDYRAVANERLGERPSPRDNAFAGLFEAWGWQDYSRHYCEAMCDALGLKDWRATGATFLPWDEFVPGRTAGERRPYDLQKYAGMEDAWSAEDLPRLDAWLNGQEAALRRIEEALHRSAYFVPFVRDDTQRPWLAGTVMPHLRYCRDVAGAWTLRAHRLLGEDRPAAALDDVRRTLTLAHRMRGEPSGVGQLASLSVEAAALKTLQRVRDHARDDVGLLAAMSEAMTARPPADFVWAIDQLERLQALELLQLVRRGEAGPHAQPHAGWFQQDPVPIARYFRMAQSPLFDADRVERHIHELFDEATAVMADPDPMAAHASAEALAARMIEGYRQATENPPRDAATYSDRVAEAMLVVPFRRMPPAIATICNSEMRWRTQHAATAVARYRLEHGELPATLAALVPAYLDAVPIDVFTGEPLRYIVGDEQVRIYSAGQNRQDDGGIEWSNNLGPLADVVAELRR